MSAKFTHIGLDNVVQNDRVLAILKPGTVTTQRYIDQAKKNKKYIEASWGRTFKSVLVLDDGTIIISAIKPQTLMRRMNGAVPGDLQEEEEEELDEGD